MSLSGACQEGLRLKKLLQDFQGDIKEPLKLYEDNQSCIELTENKKFSSFKRELKGGNVIDLIYCNSNNMLADTMTKPVRSTRIKELSGH